MATGMKPRTAAGYDQDVTSACERTLLTLLSVFGSLKDTLRLVGGLVPRYLTPAAPPDIPMHAGTSDVDMVLNLEVLAVGNKYASLANQLKARGFTRWVEEGLPASWRWLCKVKMQAMKNQVGSLVSMEKKYRHSQLNMLELFMIGISRKRFLPNC